MFSFLILLALLIRLILMPIAVHSDLFFINYFPNLLITEGTIDVLGYSKQNLPNISVSYYPPLTYFTFASFQFFYHFISSTFSPWMENIFNLWKNGLQGQAIDYIRAAPNSNLQRDIFLAKLPYLIFDIASVIILLRIVKRKILPKSVIPLWLFNPVSIYSTYLMGQFDIIPTFFVLIGFLLMKRRITIGFLLLGVAAAYKNYALLFIIPSAIIYGNSNKERIKLMVVSVAPYIISLLPTLAASYREAIFTLLPKVYLVYRKPLEGWALYSQYTKYSILALSLLVLIAFSYYAKIKDKWRFAIGISLASILIVYAIAPRISFHYLLWATPLVILWFKNIKIATALIIIQTVSLASYKLLANHLQAGLFVPLNQNLSQAPTLNNIIDQFIPYRIISSSGFFIFLLLNLFFASKIISDLLFKEPTSQRG